MSEQVRPVRGAPVTRPPLVSRPLALLFVSTFCATTSFHLLFSVVPMYAASGGAGDGGNGVAAGLATGALMLSTVAAELVTPGLVLRYGPRRVLAVGLVLLGPPALALPASAGLPTVLTVSLVRGLGFAVMVVVTGALVASLVPAERRAEGLGVSGIVVGVPAVCALPLGVWLAGHVGYTCVFAAGAVAALAALPPLLALPGRPSGGEAREEVFGMLAGLRSPVLRRMGIVFAAAAMGAGIVVTFLPTAVGGVAAAALLVQAAAATLSRWWAGRVGDRHGSRRLLVPGLLAAGTGMAGLAATDSPALVVAAMALFGAGFGVMQNASLAVMYDQVPLSGYGTVSAVWNLAFDGGMGVGGTGFGLVAAQTGYPPAFLLTGVLMLLTLPLMVRRS
ncbi:MFS transporter [Actinomadura sp. NEAU-AAG7]|uniref:MFS transporter n=1 Tax=Actinomadura sp. NEAU-AAG7 TaxID=2839640 RepID=UPI001BE47774|nr:MFS transporter [Actinomadura sp. NEAU-AAG7]MBT2213415.1 MFS transporter [Actinomadura sp. NEAU-AAG7]